MIKDRQKSRKEWIDALRALAMILVVYGHRVQDWPGFFVFTSPIKIPLFFAITGFVFKWNDLHDIKSFLYKITRTLIIPWLVLSFLPYVFAIPLKGFSFFTEHVVNILIGDEYWYMPCCVFAEIIFFFVLSLFKKTWKVILVETCSFVLGLFFYKWEILSVLMINRAFTVQIYLLIGWLIRKYENEIRKTIGKIYLFVLGTILYVSLGIITIFIYPQQVMDIHRVSYYNHIICQFMIWSGVILLFILFSTYIKRFPKIVTLIGQNTLVIYLYHYFVVSGCIKLFSICHIPVNRLTSIIISAIACLICLLISIMINKLVPELMGRQRNVKQNHLNI